jgi:hypothetical protein
MQRQLERRIHGHFRESYPSNVSRISKIHLSTVIGKIRQDDAQIDEASEEACAKTTDRRWGNLGDVYGSNNWSLANSEPGNKPSGVNGTKAAVVAHKNGDAKDPNKTQLAGGPYPANTVTYYEGTIDTR